MFSRFFIDRPIFAGVLSIVITLAGAIAVFQLPIAQYPDIAPPTVEVFAVFPGANAQVVSDTVAAPLEQQINGVEDMLYMSSQSANDGTYTLTVTFKSGADLNLAQVLVQNRVNLALPVLPELVKRRGVTVKKKAPSVLMIINLFSPDSSRDNLYLSNYATIQLRDELSRLKGVGDITLLGQRDYSMRIWLDPEKMSVRNLTASDVVRAVEQQNIQVAAGQIGQPPVETRQVFQYTMTTLGRLSDPEQFGKMILKSDSDGRITSLSDVARIELGALGYDQVCKLDGNPSVALSIFQLPGTNALETSQLVRTKMEELRGSFPPGLDFAIAYDTTPFISESINEVFVTLRDAVILVAAVVLLFLQNWRSTIIPLVAVPVAVVGTFAVMVAVGFSLNNLTLFGLVLAIGIVVDDAIVVVEAVEHHIEHGMSPRDATIQAMDEVSGPVIAVGLVLSAVFIPCLFISGIIGQFFRQFAVTIAVSTLISAFNSLTLSPALSALLLRPKSQTKNRAIPPFGFALVCCWAAYTYLSEYAKNEALARGWTVEAWMVETALGLSGFFVGWLVTGMVNQSLGLLFFVFNKVFKQFTNAYLGSVRIMLKGAIIGILVYVGLIYLTYKALNETPAGFIPAQDKGYLLVNAQLPDSASLGRTEELMKKVEAITSKTPGVLHTVSLTGQSLLLGANAPNFGSMFVMLDKFENRRSKELGSEAIAKYLEQEFQKDIPEGLINVLGAPPLDGLGTAGGFKIMIEDRGDQGLVALQKTAQRIVESSRESPELEDVFTHFRADTPWLFLDIDRKAAQTMGISMGEIFNSLQIYLGSFYINDFNRFGRTWQVTVQGDSEFRRRIDDLRRLKVRNMAGEMVSLGSITRVKEAAGPVLIARYNLHPAAAINVNPGRGASSGQAIQSMEALSKMNLGPSMRQEWTELALLQLQVGNTAMVAFGLAVVLVFLVLAAQYESWSLPLAVILVVPICLLCAVAGVRIAQMDINIFTQIGFVVLVGLASKNAILIVEFARSRREAGSDRMRATLEACRLRLRPIIMTSFAFILGVVPLVVAEGAGAEMRRTLGTAVFSGMLGVTLFGIFLTPIFYFAIQWVGDATRTSDCKPEDPKDANNSPHASMDLRDSQTIASQETKAFKALVPGGDSHG
jgi:multidrug efflux pump subunit AcrB